MGHFYMQWKRNKKYYKTIQGYANKDSKTSPTEKYNKSGIYQMKCVDCPLKLTGQTGRIFHIRYKAYIYIHKQLE